MRTANKLKWLFGVVGLSWSMWGYACPAGQVSKCIARNPLTGGCIQSICIASLPPPPTGPVISNCNQMMKLVVNNSSTSTITYHVGGTRSVLPPNQADTWKKCSNIGGATKSQITFDYSTDPGLQSAAYTLEYCHAGLELACTYTFKQTGNLIKLVKGR